MRYLLLLLMAFAVPVQAQETAQEPRFFESLYDVPIMPQLEELKDMAVSFDKPHGRIAYAGATTTQSLSSSEIISFYDKTLPQMGWKLLKTQGYLREYRRENENLRLFFVQSEGTELLQFMLFPTKNSQKR